MVADGGGGSRNRTGGLSVSLASPDGRVIGGGVGGVLIAASPVQVKCILLLSSYYVLKDHHYHVKTCNLLNLDALLPQVIVGSFTWGGSKTKIKKKEPSAEVAEVAIETDHQTVHNPVAMNSLSPNQNLTPTSSLSPWPASRPLDMRNSHIDIDLMRG